MEYKNKVVLYVGLGAGIAITAAVAYFAFRAGEHSIDEDEAATKKEIAPDVTQTEVNAEALKSQQTKKLAELDEEALKAPKLAKLKTLVTIEKAVEHLENAQVKAKRESLGAFNYDDAEFDSKHASMRFETREKTVLENEAAYIG